MYFVGSTKYNSLFDSQVTKDICSTYRYCVRSAGTGRNSAFSQTVVPCVGSAEEYMIYEKPLLSVVPREKNRIDLFWTPVCGTLPISHYEIYRNGDLIAETTDSYITSYRDYGVCLNEKYDYSVTAVDVQGNKCSSDHVHIHHCEEFFADQDSAVAKKSKGRFLHFK